METENSSTGWTSFMALAVAGLALLAICSFYLLVISSRRGGKQRRNAPVVGTVFHQLYYVRRLHDYHTDLSRKHKTFQLLAPASHRQIYTCNPAVVEHILRTNFANYGKGPFNYENMRDLFGDGIFAVDGDKWRQQRKIASYDFSTRALRDFSGAVFKKNAAKLAGIVSSNAASKQFMDIQASQVSFSLSKPCVHLVVLDSVFLKLLWTELSFLEYQDLVLKATMDSIFTIAFGLDLDTLGGSGEGSRFATAFDDASEFTLLRYVNPFWKVTRLLNVGAEAMLKERINVIDNFVYKRIRARAQELSNGKAQDPVSHHLLRPLHHVILLSSTNSAHRTRPCSSMFVNKQDSRQDILRDIILNIVIAGKDTTAGALAWFIYMACKHPEVQEKICQEITVATNAGETASVDEFVLSLTDEALNKMHYLHAVLTETLRLYPSVPLDNKQCFSDDVLPDGSSVSKGDIVFYIPYAMGRMEYLWGKDADVFRPERWLDANGQFQPESPFKFTAFQAGPRICLGKEFAYRQMKIFAAVLLRFFALRLLDEKATVNYRTMITLPIEEGLHLVATAR
ncbi:hypothetical protein PR202_gb07275 [Eleusine coracana subsp. coracana]|uniref:Uncharacterized protein n=1 Tax=Eleusine coracana subsp. coracana TaxID=191504 RepID=A0AAV5EBG6_ELECO|nr:hypothetical protein PR202_gb07275 [Eleusine coracana subsp. coracana]